MEARRGWLSIEGGMASRVELGGACAARAGHAHGCVREVAIQQGVDKQAKPGRTHPPTWITVKVMTKMVSHTAMGITHRARCTATEGAGEQGQTKVRGCGAGRAGAARPAACWADQRCQAWPS